MRQIKYISPSSLSTFEEKRREFYEKYLCETRAIKSPQVGFMAVGSGFDALVKSKIYEDVHGPNSSKGTQFEFQTIFEAQVDEHARDDALMRAQDIFDQYVESGAYDALIKDILKSPFEPEMEFEVRGEVNGVPLLGKPDLRYVTEQKVHVICDWKVNGSTSKTGASPYVRYQIARDNFDSRTNGQPHKNYRGDAYKDVMIEAFPLEEKYSYWADQLAIYAWLLGEEVGSQNFVVRMEQAACRKIKKLDLPRVKFATHMNRISAGYQHELLARINMCWSTIQSGHIFDDRTREESDELCAILDGKAKVPIGLYPQLDPYRKESTRFK